MPDVLSITEAAREGGAPPYILSHWLWRGRIDRERCIRLGGRTFLPRDYYTAVILPMLRRAGYRPPVAPTSR